MKMKMKKMMKKMWVCVLAARVIYIYRAPRACLFFFSPLFFSILIFGQVGALLVLGRWYGVGMYGSDRTGLEDALGMRFDSTKST